VKQKVGMKSHAVILLILLLGSFPGRVCAQQSNSIHEKLARSLSSDLGSLYIDAVTAFGSKDIPLAAEKYDALLKRATALEDRLGTGLGLAGTGAVRNALEEYSSAFDSWTEALSFLTEPVARIVEGWVYAALGEVSLRLNEPRRAIGAFDKALSIAQELTTKNVGEELKIINFVQGEILRQKAFAHEQVSEFAEALHSAMLAGIELERVGNKTMTAFALWHAGNLQLHKLNQRREAITQYSRATALFEDAGDLPSAAATRAALGWAYYSARSWREAEASFSRALTTAPSSLSEVRLDAKYGLARTSEDSGDFNLALSRYKEVLEDTKTTGTTTVLASEPIVLVHMGNIHRLLSQYEFAIEHFLRAADKYRERGSTHDEADTLTRLADTFAWLGEFEIASGYYKNALSLYKSSDDDIVVPQIRILAALVEAVARVSFVNVVELKRYADDAVALKSKAEIEVKKELESFWKTAGQDTKLQISKANIEFAQQDYAWRHNKDVSSLATESPYNSDVARFHSELQNGTEFGIRWGRMLPGLGPDYIGAIGLLFQKLGMLQVLSGQATEAIPLLVFSKQHFLMLLSLDREMIIELAKTYYFLGMAYHQLLQNQAALYYLNAAFFLGDYLQTPEIHWVYSMRANVFAELGDYDSALSDYRKGIDILESVKSQSGLEAIKLAIGSGTSYIYRDFVDFLLSQYAKTQNLHDLEEAFEYTQKGKARVFIEMLEKNVTKSERDDAIEDAEKRREVERDIAQLHNRLRNAEEFSIEGHVLMDQLASLRGQQAEISRKQGALNLPNEPNALSLPPKISEIQAILRSDTALLDYFDSSSGITCWVITHDQARHFRVSSKESAAILEYNETLRSPLIGSVELKRHLDLGERVYKALIEPASDLLTDKTKLVISPDAGLHYLPFETLIVPRGNNRSRLSLTVSIPYLIRDFSITYSASASTFVLQHKSVRPTDNKKLPLLAFGDPIYSESSVSGGGIKPSDIFSKSTIGGLRLKRLEFSNSEINGVAKIWDVPRQSGHINLRERATVENLKSLDLSQYRIIHFAVHAIAKDQFGIFSQPALILTQNDGGASKGLLRFSDILQLKQSAELVILSACETGLGQLKDGEGIVGLTRAFLQGGAASAVVSLWRVEDQSTSLLMQKFHERLKGGQSKEEALRDAKLEIMKTQIQLKATGNVESLASPFFWAPFVLIGNGGPINLPN